MPRVPVPAWRRSRTPYVPLVALCLCFCFCFSFGLGLAFSPAARADGHLAVGQDATVEADLLLRALPTYDATVVMPVDAGTAVGIVDGPVAASDGSIWYEVTVSGEQGFLPGGALSAVAPSGNGGKGDEPGVSGDMSDTSDTAVEAAVTGEAAVVTTALNLRSGPSTVDAVLLVMPAGARVTLTGSSTNGFVSVDYNGTRGWAYRSYLDSGGTAAPAPAPSQPGAPSGASAVTTADLNLRSSASLSAPVLLVMPAGATVAVTGAAQNGFTPVTYGGQSGWAYSGYLSSGGSGEDGSNGETGTARVTEALNLRTGPSTADGVITVMPAGATVTLTGNRASGFLSVSYNGTAGWSYAAYLETGNSSPSPDTPSNPDSGVGTGTARTTTALNLRAGPSTSDGVLLVMPGGASVALTGNSANGFLSVAYNGVAGWAYGDYLTTGGGSGSTPPAGGGGGIAWPVSGGTWQIIQGYNGGTHQNRSASAQYYYALDIARVDGNTAGQPVRSPVNGTIRWVHPASGGIAIDMGNGYVVAMFHATFAASLGAGQAVQQGQYLGTISGPGGNGYAATPHLEIDVWRSSDGGGTRSSATFTGANAISGMSFPDIGGWNQHYGTRFTP